MKIYIYATILTVFCLISTNIFSQKSITHNFHKNFIISTPSYDGNYVFKMAKKPKSKSGSDEKTLVFALSISPSFNSESQLFIMSTSEYNNNSAYKYNLNYFVTGFLGKWKFEAKNKYSSTNFSNVEYYDKNGFEIAYVYSDIENYNLKNVYNFYSISMSPDRRTIIFIKGEEIPNSFSKNHILNALKSMNYFSKTEYLKLK